MSLRTDPMLLAPEIERGLEMVERISKLTSSYMERQDVLSEADVAMIKQLQDACSEAKASAALWFAMAGIPK